MWNISSFNGKTHYVYFDGAIFNGYDKVSVLSLSDLASPWSAASGVMFDMAGKPSENPRKMVVLWDLYGIYLLVSCLTWLAGIWTTYL